MEQKAREAGKIMYTLSRTSVVGLMSTQIGGMAAQCSLTKSNAMLKKMMYITTYNLISDRFWHVHVCVCGLCDAFWHGTNWFRMKKSRLYSWRLHVCVCAWATSAHCYSVVIFYLEAVWRLKKSFSYSEQIYGAYPPHPSKRMPLFTNADF